MMTPPPSLLIVHQGALGDLVCIFPIMALLRRHFRPVAILCQGPVGRLAAAERLVDAWFPLEAAWAASLYTQNPVLKARKAFASFSHILLFSKSEILAAALQEITGARIGRIPPRPPVGQRMHPAEYAMSHIREYGWLPQTATEMIRMMDPSPRFAAGVRKNQASNTVLLHPGAGSPRKRWPLIRFRELADLIITRRMIPEFVIGPADHDLLPELEHHNLAVHRPADGLHLLKLYRAAAAYVGNDSGASHLAAWTNLPTVVIFGPTDPARWRPLGRTVEIVQPPLRCMPCFEGEAANCITEDCLTATVPEAVLDALERVILIRPSVAAGNGAPVGCGRN